MQKFLKWFLMSLGALILIGVIGYQWMLHNTKKHSPLDKVEYVENGERINIEYCRPYKKGRDVFGELVVYGKVWRTGANEPTTFENTADLIVNGKTLPAGKYTLWTVPNKEEWEIMFNEKQYSWGVGMDAEASREPEHDVLVTKAPVETLNDTIEQFTIDVTQAENMRMTFTWDDVHVELPLEWAE